MNRLSLRDRLNAAVSTTSAAQEPEAEASPIEPSTRTLTSQEFEDVVDALGPVANFLREYGINSLSGTEGNGGSVTDSSVPSQPNEENEEYEEDWLDPTPPPDPYVATLTHTQSESRRTDIQTEALSRFSGALWFEEIGKQYVTIVGVGGIGSWTALLVSRLGVHSIVLYDDDTVELGNISGQFYSAGDVGNSKVDSLAVKLSDYSCFSNVGTYTERYTRSTGLPSPIMISCLDSMQSRREMFESWKNMVYNNISPDERRNCLFIDGRLSAEVLQVFAVPGDDDASMKRYEDTLFSDYEADGVQCSYKQTSFMANMIASVITNVLVNYVASKLTGGASREVPFKTEYTGEVMYFKTEY